MKVYKRGDNDELLIHSDTYLGEDYISPNLVHWKYLRKEERNGYTYYVYNDSERKMHKFLKDKSVGYIKDTIRNNYNRNSKTLTLNKDQEREVRNALNMVKVYYKQAIKDIPRRIHARGLSFVSNIFKAIRGDL